MTESDGEGTGPRPPLLAAALATVAVASLAAGALDVAADHRARRTLESPRQAGGAMPEGASRLRPDALRYRLVAARGHEATGTVAGLEAGLAQLDRAADLSPRDPVVARERARLLLERARRTDRPDHLAEALAALEALVTGDPHNAEALLRLGLARALAGDGGGAERAWLAAERLAPASAAASTNLAIAYARAGRDAEARSAARRALARDPGAERAARVLAELDGRDGT